jgi:hypothetical protein
MIISLSFRNANPEIKKKNLKNDKKTEKKKRQKEQKYSLFQKLLQL